MITEQRIAREFGRVKVYVGPCSYGGWAWTACKDGRILKPETVPNKAAAWGAACVEGAEAALNPPAKPAQV